MFPASNSRVSSSSTRSREVVRPLARVLIGLFREPFRLKNRKRDLKRISAASEVLPGMEMTLKKKNPKPSARKIYCNGEIGNLGSFLRQFFLAKPWKMRILFRLFHRFATGVIWGIKDLHEKSRECGLSGRWQLHNANRPPRRKSEQRGVRHGGVRLSPPLFLLGSVLVPFRLGRDGVIKSTTQTVHFR